MTQNQKNKLIDQIAYAEIAQYDTRELKGYAIALLAEAMRRDYVDGKLTDKEITRQAKELK